MFKADLVEAIRAGAKTQTRRPVRWGQPCYYKAGRSYAVVPGHGKRAVLRIRVVDVERVVVDSISRADARAEGFKSPDAFYERWRSMYGDLRGWCWKITFCLDTPATEGAST